MPHSICTSCKELQVVSRCQCRNHCASMPAVHVLLEGPENLPAHRPVYITFRPSVLEPVERTDFSGARTAEDCCWMHPQAGASVLPACSAWRRT